jgi:hypothetical protein
LCNELAGRRRPHHRIREGKKDEWNWSQDEKSEGNRNNLYNIKPSPTIY